jgi:hypothetical protein
MNMKDEEQLALASFYGTWETGRLIDAMMKHSTEYAPQALWLMAKEIEKRGVREPAVESFINDQAFSALADRPTELAAKEGRGVVDGRSTGTSKHKRQSVARPWWFLIPLPATLVTYVVVTLSHMSVESTGGADRLEVLLMFAGMVFFPVGLFSFVLPRGSFAYPGLVVLACLGYGLYLAVITWGCCRPSLKLFFVLCGMLLLNIVGCCKL